MANEAIQATSVSVGAIYLVSVLLLQNVTASPHKCVPLNRRGLHIEGILVTVYLFIDEKWRPKYMKRHIHVAVSGGMGMERGNPEESRAGLA